MNFPQEIYQHFLSDTARPALCINDTFHTYNDLALKISSIQKVIPKSPKGKKIIGIYTANDIETYASILACWLSGFAFVPLNPQNPEERNKNILMQVDAAAILGSGNIYPVFDYPFICTRDLPAATDTPVLTNIKEEDLLCILFTSGSTGNPKGVPMNRRNMDSTLEAFFALDYKLSSEDGFLQMFDFSFDMSLLSYVPALMLGSCIYTVPEDKIRYLAALKVLQKYPVTFAAMVPSTLTFLRPYFSKIRLEKLRYSVLGGEPFYNDLAVEWANCIPNARIINISGPTEITMACMGYDVKRDASKNKHRNGILAFGKPWKNTTAIVVDSDLKPLPDLLQGELCFAGEHVMDGYWKMEEKNKEVFFFYSGRYFYRTGDMAIRDSEGDYYTCGRIDHQVKIQGHKVELGEIEHHAREYLSSPKAVAIAATKTNGIVEVALFIGPTALSDAEILAHLKTKVPSYMIPSKIVRVDEFPVNTNGKTDRLALSRML